MPDLLLELFSEEIPARMQQKAAEDLKRIATERLVDAGLGYEGARAFVTPRTTARGTVRFSVAGIAAGAVSQGHRFLAQIPFSVRRFEDYVQQLERAKVVLDADRRAQMILADARNLAFAQGGELVEDEA